MSTLRASYDRLSSGGRGSYSTRKLTLDGTQVADNNMAVNGSVTPVDFWYTPVPGDLFRLDIIHLSITDNGAPEYDGYGSIPGPLPNGTRFFTERAGVRVYSDSVFQTNVDWITIASSSELYQMATTSRIVVYTAQYAEFSEGPFLGGDNNNDKFGVQIQDDLSTIQLHYCTLSGAMFRGVV